MRLTYTRENCDCLLPLGSTIELLQLITNTNLFVYSRFLQAWFFLLLVLRAFPFLLFIIYIRSGQPGHIVWPPYKTNNLQASGEHPVSLQLFTTLLNAFAEWRNSPNPSKKVVRKGIRHTSLQNDRRLEYWLDFRLNLAKGERVACE